MKKVLITGANGFIGKNLILNLSNENDVELLKYDKENTIQDLEKYVMQADFIYHLAGINRPKEASEFYEGNFDLTKKLIDLLNKYKKNIPVIFTSSIQAELNNDYGISKKQAEDYLYSNYNNTIIFRLHNVFGKWCKPNYNSVVATFCYNIANGLDITINNPDAEIELVYVDDICQKFVNILKGTLHANTKEINYIDTRKKITLKELSELIYSFKDCMNSIYVPKTGDEFMKKLFATYVSYVPLNNMMFTPIKHTDERGAFCELVRTNDSGQFSISYSKPGIVRGNHYHHTKIERFIVVKGKAKITFKNVITNEKKEYIISEDKLEIVTIPVGYTHSIENIGDKEMVLFIWCNELFDDNKPDTYFLEI